MGDLDLHRVRPGASPVTLPLRAKSASVATPHVKRCRDLILLGLVAFLLLLLEGWWVLG